MKLLPSLILLLSLCTAQAQQRRVRMIGSGDKRSFEERLDGQTEWQMHNGETLKIASAKGAVQLSAPQGTIIEIPRPEHVAQVVPSRSASFLLLRVMAARPSGGSDYSRLVRISRDAHGRWVAHTLFAKDAPPMNELHRGISEIGVISDSGRMALLKVGEADQEATPYRMNYSWQTWLLDQPKKVADGIRVPEDFDK